jgi:hypothetical protein
VLIVVVQEWSSEMASDGSAGGGENDSEARD